MAIAAGPGCALAEPHWGGLLLNAIFGALMKRRVGGATVSLDGGGMGSAHEIAASGRRGAWTECVGA
jgi:hypothetical protein